MQIYGSRTLSFLMALFGRFVITQLTQQPFHPLTIRSGKERIIWHYMSMGRLYITVPRAPQSRSFGIKKPSRDRV